MIDVTHGGIIHSEDLLAALESGQLGGAGLDTPPGEPISADNPIWRFQRESRSTEP